LTTKRVAEAEEADRNAKLEALVEMQSQKIAEIEVACADLKQEKENLTAGYRRLLEKHKALIEEAEREKTKLVEAQATELAGIKGEMDKETQDYTDYCIDGGFFIRRLPFPTRNAKVKDLIDWVGEEVQVVSDNVWRLNDNFVVLAIKGVLNLLNDAGCQELAQLRGLAASSDASVVKNIPNDVWRLAGCLVQKWWEKTQIVGRSLPT
jgi:hypothetical protein